MENTGKPFTLFSAIKDKGLFNPSAWPEKVGNDLSLNGF